MISIILKLIMIILMFCEKMILFGAITTNVGVMLVVIIWNNVNLWKTEKELYKGSDTVQWKF